jgi:Bacteriocin-protection, YdeI or OmpD-Associated/Domain of unknown function (DUF1905)
MSTSPRGFTAIVEPRPRGGITVKLPFDPSAEWGSRERYDVSGTVDGHKVRGRLRSGEGGYYLELGPAWCRDERVLPGTRVSVSLAPEGPQMGSLAADFAAALDAEPQARQFFESLATFYRKNFVRWVEEAKRPETRAKRIADSVAVLKAGRRER